MPLPMTRAKRHTEQPADGERRKRGKGVAEEHEQRSEHREQLLATAERLLSERGLACVGVADVCTAAQVSPADLDALFGDLDGLLNALFDRIVTRVGRSMNEAYRSEAVWVDAIRATLFELLAFLDGRPQLARFLIVESLRGDAALLARRERAVGALAAVIEADRPDTAGAAPPFGADAVVGAAASVIHGRLLEEPVPSLRELAGALMGVLVMPYLGAAAVREELSRPVQPPSLGTAVRSAPVSQLARATSSPLRLTNGTAQVLETIAAHPGMSSSAIASTVGVVEQGQIAKLLARLRENELIEDTSARSTSRAWRLTRAGWSLIKDLQSPPAHRPLK